MFKKNKLVLLLSLFFTCSSFAASNIKVIEPADDPYEALRYNQQIEQQLTQPVQQQNYKLETKEEREPINNMSIGTAAEQGYVNPNKNKKQFEILEKMERMNTPRQFGYKVEVPQLVNTVKNSKDLKMWYINWKGVLVEKVGITSEKVDFEASRLSKEDFERWATDFLYYHFDGFKNQERTIYNYTE